MNNPTYSTYSFSQTNFVINHPDIGQCVLTGMGVGSIVVAYANDASSQEAAHDGSVMTNKIVLKNGTISFTLQQTSSGNAWMKAAYSKLLIADASKWAQFNGTIENHHRRNHHLLQRLHPEAAGQQFPADRPEQFVVVPLRHHRKPVNPQAQTESAAFPYWRNAALVRRR